MTFTQDVPVSYASVKLRSSSKGSDQLHFPSVLEAAVHTYISLIFSLCVMQLSPDLYGNCKACVALCNIRFAFKGDVHNLARIKFKDFDALSQISTVKS